MQFPVIESCEGCGACCLQTAVPPFVLLDGVHEAIVRKVPQQLLDDLMPAWSIRLDYPEQPCLWFDQNTKQCRHYDYRPQACRNFELNSVSCHLIRERWEID